MKKLSPKIVFHHVPKCGGMSIAAGLALTYYPFRILRYGRYGFPAHLNARAATQAANTLSIDRYQYRRMLLEYHLGDERNFFVSGHYPYSRNATQRFDCQWSFVTLLRNPVDRWYSEYFWNRYKNHDYAKTDMDMESYLESMQGQMDAHSFLNFFAERENPAAKASDLEFKEAISNLESFDVVGVLERIDAFRGAMKQRFGRKPFFFKRNKNPASPELYKRPDQNSEFHKRLLGFLEADQEIYNHILRKSHL